MFRDSRAPEGGEAEQPGFSPRIEGLRMQTVYYSLMKETPCCGCGGVFGDFAGAAGGRATSETAADVNSGCARGCDDRSGAVDAGEPIQGKVSEEVSVRAGIVALKLSIRTTTMKRWKLTLRRIRLLVQLDAENRQELEALTADDVADAVMLRQNGKDPTARRLPIPLPINRPKPTRDKNWEEFRGIARMREYPRV